MGERRRERDVRARYEARRCACQSGGDGMEERRGPGQVLQRRVIVAAAVVA